MDEKRKTMMVERKNLLQSATYGSYLRYYLALHEQKQVTWAFNSFEVEDLRRLVANKTHQTFLELYRRSVYRKKIRLKGVVLDDYVLLNKYVTFFASVDLLIPNGSNV